MKRTTLLVRDILDKQLVDRNGRNMGKVDGVIIELRDDKPPRVTYIEVGAITLARRLNSRLAEWVKSQFTKVRLARSEAYLIPWSKVRDIGIDVEIDMNAETCAAFKLERWIRDHIIRHIPGA
ncbi:MAG TPA: hypothetical protein VFC63_12585 [Blastocatellia bacterium]|nr:hypothetical protein [Blastocatellia bacterium]